MQNYTKVTNVQAMQVPVAMVITIRHNGQYGVTSEFFLDEGDYLVLEDGVFTSVPQDTFEANHRKTSPQETGFLLGVNGMRVRSY